MMHKPLPVVGILLSLVVILHGVGAALLVPGLAFKADLTVDSDGDPRIARAWTDERDFPTPNPLVFTTTRESRETLVSLLEARGMRVRPAPTPNVVYVLVSGDGQAEAALCHDLADRVPGTVVGGEPWVRFLMDQALARNLAWLFPLSLVVVALVFLVLTRRPGRALWLTLASTLPALDVLFLFPLLGLTFNFTTILAPLLVLALCKKYNLWVHRHIEVRGTDQSVLIAEKGRAIAWSASISSLGFASLWLSPVPSLRQLGLLLVLGLAATLFWALWGVPTLERAFPTRSQPPRPWSVPQWRWGRWFLLALLLASLPGWSLVSSALHWSDYLVKSSTEARQLQTFEDQFPAWQTATLRLTWDAEGAWIDAQRWAELKAMVAQWRRESPTITVWSADDLAEAGQKELGIGTKDLSSDEVGELFELLPPDTVTGKWIDGARSSLVVRFGVPGDLVRVPGFAHQFDVWAADAQHRFPGVQTTWSGPLYRNLLGMEDFLRGELWGTVLYFLVTGTVIVIRLRSFRRGLAALVPALGAGLVMVGLSGWLRWPISPATALIVAACLGQATDDGLLWGLLPPTPEIRRFFVESTGLLCSALAVLGLSTFSNINQASFLVIVALLFSTAVVLWVLPWRNRP